MDSLLQRVAMKMEDFMNIINWCNAVALRLFGTWPKSEFY